MPFVSLIHKMADSHAWKRRLALYIIRISQTNWLCYKVAFVRLEILKFPRSTVFCRSNWITKSDWFETIFEYVLDQWETERQMFWRRPLRFFFNCRLGEYFQLEGGRCGLMRVIYKPTFSFYALGGNDLTEFFVSFWSILLLYLWHFIPSIHRQILAASICPRSRNILSLNYVLSSFSKWC